MAFASTFINDPTAVGAGERFGPNVIALGAIDFEDNLKVGRFAKFDTGSIDNMDGSATPVIAGVVLRPVANAVELGGVLDADLYGQIEYLRQGIVTVDVKAGETPARFGRVYVSNAGDANDGLATATATDEPVNGEFLHEVQSGVWAIYLTPPAGDIATHIGDALGAHAASAISLLDAAGFTTAVNVEDAIAELFTHFANAIADPGDAGAIPVDESGTVAITTAGAETRTLAVPTFAGQRLTISEDVYVGDAVITVAAAINQAGNTTITLNGAGDTVELVAVQVGGSLVWRVVFNDGAALA